ncbi:cytochrome d ubiquinol oxidase subunit II [Kineococcus gypseus]|uniref:cytochrome d ubiquinol oxidase subunit II n=1 Tax=Kineococcus gypseus TaxID=1637102 RepID=UPI003D7F04DF
MDLPVIWFGVAVLAWVLFFVLEGFDFGVGFLGPLLGRSDAERGAAVRTVGPVWDGNEVWLVAAIGVTFAAFPDWYAALLSGLYLPVVAVLLLLAVRGVALEFRGKHDSARWHARCDAFLASSSLLLAALWGAVLGVLVQGLALGADGEVRAGDGALGALTRSLEPLTGPWAVLGALAGVLLAAVHGAAFLSLRTTGVLRERARLLAVAAAPALATCALAVFAAAGHPAVAAAAVLLALAAVAAWRRAEALAFAASSAAVAVVVAAVFTAHALDGPAVLLPSTLGAAGDVTLRGAAASPAALELISVVGVVVLPGVLAYQVWSYWVFRRRVASGTGRRAASREPAPAGR